jgi:UDP-glucose 4-epimerase
MRDIAGAHLAAADSTATLPLAMNAGTDRGGSVCEVIKPVCDAAVRADVVVEEKERLAGYSTFLCADVSVIKSVIGFSSNFTLKQST